MRTSDKGRNFIKRLEGYSDEPYLDQAGFGTIGWGHLIHKDDLKVTRITEEEAEALFEMDIGTAERTVDQACKTVALQQHEFDALVSFTYNVGQGAFRSSTLLKELLASRPLQAAQQFKRWNIAGGKVDKILVRRRADEAHLFNTGEY